MSNATVRPTMAHACFELQGSDNSDNVWLAESAHFWKQYKILTSSSLCQLGPGSLRQSYDVPTYLQNMEKKQLG